MRVGERRALTFGEVALARSVFGDELTTGAVRLLQAPALGFGAMVPLGRTIVFSRWRAARDFADAGIAAQGWLVHELTHCWQAERGRVLAYAKLGALGARAYEFTLGKPFAAYNIEQQAEIARYLFLARAGAAATPSPSLPALEDLWRQR